MSGILHRTTASDVLRTRRRFASMALCFGAMPWTVLAGAAKKVVELPSEVAGITLPRSRPARPHELKAWHRALRFRYQLRLDLTRDVEYLVVWHCPRPPRQLQCHGGIHMSRFDPIEGGESMSVPRNRADAAPSISYSTRPNGVRLLRQPLTPALGVSVIFAIAIGGLFYVKWLPYFHKSMLAFSNHSIGHSILMGDAAQPPSVSWRAAIDYSLAYGKAIWQAMLLGLLLGAAVQEFAPRAWLARLLGGSGLRSVTIRSE